MSESPVEQTGFSGVGLTEAVCPKHGKPRFVSADALFVKGAPLQTYAIKCLIPLKAVVKGKDAGAPLRTGEASANQTVMATGAPHDDELCQEFLVPLNSINEDGTPARKNGKLVEVKQGEGPAETGGEKLARASDPKRAAKAKNESSAAGIDTRGGKGVTVADESGNVEPSVASKSKSKKKSTSAKKSSPKKKAA